MRKAIGPAVETKRQMRSQAVFPGCGIDSASVRHQTVKAVAIRRKLRAISAMMSFCTPGDNSLQERVELPIAAILPILLLLELSVDPSVNPGKARPRGEEQGSAFDCEDEADAQRKIDRMDAPFLLDERRPGGKEKGRVRG